jgi:AraC-like DNA-binding protein
MSTPVELSAVGVGQGLTVLVIVTSNEWRRHILHALRWWNGVVCEPHNRWQEAAAVRRPDAVIIHLDPQSLSEASLPPFIARVRARCGSNALATYSDLDAESVRLLGCAVRSGIQPTWLRGHDHIATRVRELTHRNCVSAIIANVLDAVDPVPAGIRVAVIRCLHGSLSNRLTVARLSEELGVSRRTLVNRFNVAGYPSPAAFITWSRLLVSARLLDDPSVRVSEVVRWLHFLSPSQYRGMLQRYAGVTPTELRRRGALITLADRFRSRGVGRYRHHSSASALDTETHRRSGVVSHRMTGYLAE